MWKDPAYLALAATLILFAGLRTEYNDTWNYTNGFRNSLGLEDFMSNPDNMNIFRNPLFYFCYSVLRDITGNAQWLVFLTSIITQTGFLLFFKRYSHSFTFSVFIFIALGTFNLSLAAMKQVCAMAIATYAFPYLEKKQWARYYLVVLTAMLVHTYALAYAILPLFTNRPWSWFTYLFCFFVAVIMLNFTEAITAFMDQAEDLGKSLSEKEVLDAHTVNLLRVAVYTVAPLISFVFQRWIFQDATKMDHVLVHMSIISFAFMLMGTQAGANMFARMAHYFELATACCLPWMIGKPFDKKSHRLVATIAVVCFSGFFIYANGIDMHFDSAYKATTIRALFG